MHTNCDHLMWCTAHIHTQVLRMENTTDGGTEADVARTAERAIEARRRWAEVTYDVALIPHCTLQSYIDDSAVQ
jgi:hypothetical protein